jgi:hypothetical protein
MMNPLAAALSNPSASRWWRPDARVAAHLRAPKAPLVNLLVGALAPMRRSMNAGDGHRNAFAATRWADTEWADTCSDPLSD